MRFPAGVLQWGAAAAVAAGFRWRGAATSAMNGTMKCARRATGWLAAAWLAAGCAGDHGTTRTETTSRRSSGDPLLEKYAGNFDYRKGTDGTQRVVSDRRSGFEGKEAAGFGKTIDKKEFRTTAYDKKPWWGTKDYATSAYAGPTDGSRFQKKSRFSGQAAREGTLVAHDAGTVYRTKGYATREAREATAKKLDKPADAWVESRQAANQPPRIVDWQQARKLQVNETRSLLGRE